MNKKPNVLSRLFNFNTLAITLSLVVAMPVQAQQLSHVISFGDSLSDALNVASVTTGLPAGNSFTTNPSMEISQQVRSFVS